MSLKLGTTDISGVPTALIENVNNKADVSTVVNTRFDGQWVSSIRTLSTATAVGDYTMDLSDYLPNDNYDYEVILNIKSYRSSTSGSSDIYIYSDDFPTNLSNGNQVINVGANARVGTNRFIFPICLNRKVYMKIEIGNLSENTLTVLAYRRIGTNS